MKTIGAAVALALLFAVPAAEAQKKYDPGASDGEILVGQTMPYSGPLSALGNVGRATAAYLETVNAQGGVNGRKVKLISLDDGYSPPKTVEQTRKLVEQDEVLFIFNTLGTPTNTAIHKYLNTKKIPHLFLTSGAEKWIDPKHYPWTMPGMPSYQTEGGIYARYILAERPAAKIALLIQNDDFGRDYAHGFRKALGDKAKQVVAEVTYEVTDPTIDSQITTLKASGADAFFSITTGKFTSQAIRRAADIGWQPLFVIPLSATSIATVLKPAGLDKSVGIVTAQYQKNPSDPQWKDDPGVRDYVAFVQKAMPGADPYDSFIASGYSYGMLLVQVLKQCGDDLTRENVLRQAAGLKGVQLPLYLPGITLDTGPDDYRPIQQLRLQRFDGEKWVSFGDLIRDAE